MVNGIPLRRAVVKAVPVKPRATQDLGSRKGAGKPDAKPQLFDVLIKVTGSNLTRGMIAGVRGPGETNDNPARSTVFVSPSLALVELTMPADTYRVITLRDPALPFAVSTEVVVPKPEEPKKAEAPSALKKASSSTN